MMDTLMDKWDKAFKGLRALVTQTYTEANVKNGLQFEASMYNAAVAPAGNFDIEFATGSKPVIIKNRQVAFTGIGITANVFEAPTTSAGTASAVYNLNRVGPVATTVTCKTAPTVTDTGTQAGATTYGLGGSGVGPTIVSAFAVNGAERVLKPNTKYLLRITNNDAAAQKITVYTSWFEGGTDLPEA